MIRYLHAAGLPPLLLALILALLPPASARGQAPRGESPSANPQARARGGVPIGEPVRFQSIAAEGVPAIGLRGWWTPPEVPQGRGRSGAVVLMHGCNGPSVSGHRWARQLADWGYGALVVDSFGPRKLRSVCGEASRMPSHQRVGDAYGALLFLQTQRAVDPDRIVVMGWSHGGSAALWAVNKQWGPRFRPFPWVRFQAAAAFYPGCAVDHTEFMTPVLILMGGADTWAPLSPCTRMVKTQRQNGAEIQIVVYPGATHAFDAVRNTTELFGHVLEYHPSATEDAHAKVRALLAEHARR